MNWKSLIFSLLFVMFTLSVIFYPELGTAAPAVDYLGWELSTEIVMMIGIWYMARREGHMDAYSADHGLPIDHAQSAFERIMLTGFAMLLLSKTALSPLYFAWNLSMYLAAYSFIFNIYYNKKRGLIAFPTITHRVTNRYDRFFRWICGGNGRAAVWVKSIFEFSAIPTLFILQHFGL